MDSNIQHRFPGRVRNDYMSNNYSEEYPTDTEIGYVFVCVDCDTAFSVACTSLEIATCPECGSTRCASIGTY